MKEKVEEMQQGLQTTDPVRLQELIELWKATADPEEMTVEEINYVEMLRVVNMVEAYLPLAEVWNNGIDVLSGQDRNKMITTPGLVVLIHLQ